MFGLLKLLKLGVLSLPLFLLSCGPSPLTIRAVAPVNVNKEGESLPVKVRIYALIDDRRFVSALFSDLWLRDKEVLGDDRLQDAKVFVIAPRDPTGKPDEIDLGALPQETRFIGVMALYQHPDEPDRRRVVIPVDLLEDRIVELVDRSIVVYVNGDPSPVRPIPDEKKPAPEKKSEATSDTTAAKPATTEKSSPTSDATQASGSTTKSDGDKKP
jgi:type VI secretion system VasD/TssJ family lipoprotein